MNPMLYIAFAVLVLAWPAANAIARACKPADGHSYVIAFAAVFLAFIMGGAALAIEALQ